MEIDILSELFADRVAKQHQNANQNLTHGFLMLKIDQKNNYVVKQNEMRQIAFWSHRGHKAKIFCKIDTNT